MRAVLVCLHPGTIDGYFGVTVVLFDCSNILDGLSCGPEVVPLYDTSGFARVVSGKRVFALQPLWPVFLGILATIL